VKAVLPKEFYQGLNQAILSDQSLDYYMTRPASDGRKFWTVEDIRPICAVSQKTRAYLKRFYTEKTIQSHYGTALDEIDLLKKIDLYLQPNTKEHTDFLARLGIHRSRWSRILHKKLKIRVYEYLCLVNLLEDTPLWVPLLDHLLVVNRATY
jgi:hypothetical protein